MVCHLCHHQLNFHHSLPLPLHPSTSRTRALHSRTAPQTRVAHKKQRSLPHVERHSVPVHHPPQLSQSAQPTLQHPMSALCCRQTHTSLRHSQHRSDRVRFVKAALRLSSVHKQSTDTFIITPCRCLQPPVQRSGRRQHQSSTGEAQVGVVASPQRQHLFSRCSARCV